MLAGAQNYHRQSEHTLADAHAIHRQHDRQFSDQNDSTLPPTVASSAPNLVPESRTNDRQNAEDWLWCVAKWLWRLRFLPCTERAIFGGPIWHTLVLSKLNGFSQNLAETFLKRCSELLPSRVSFGALLKELQQIKLKTFFLAHGVYIYTCICV